MKVLSYFMLALALVCSGVTPVAYAAGDSASSSKSRGPTAVQKELAQIKTVNAKINLNADYYIYYFSASWCGPCQKLMPSTVAEYNSMKRAKRVELILVCGDKSMDKAAAYVKQHKAKFPMLLTSSDDARALPSCKTSGFIPSACIIDKNGKVIKTGHGSIVKDWKKYCSEPVGKDDGSYQKSKDDPAKDKAPQDGSLEDDTIVDKVLDFSIRKLFD